MTIPFSAWAFLVVVFLAASIISPVAERRWMSRTAASPRRFWASRWTAMGVAGLLGLLSMYRVLAQTGPILGPLTFDSVTPDSVVVHLPALPEGASSFSLQRAVAPAVVPDPLTAGLQVWLKADAITNASNNSPIASWPDSSGHSQDATQSNAWQQPQWIANAINGRPSIKLDGNDDLLQFPDQNDIRTVFVVFRHHTGYQNFAPMLGSQNVHFHGGVDNYLFDGNWTSPPVKNGDVFLNGQAVVATQVNKPTSFSLISLVTTGPVNVNSLSTQINTGGRNWNGDYAEVMLYNTPLSTTDRQAVEAYLLTKYALGAPASNLTWNTIATGLAGNSTCEDSDLSANTRYVYRCVAHVDGPNIEGAPASVTTLPGSGHLEPPNPPAAPTVLGVTSDAVEIKEPVLPTGATSLNLQRAAAGGTLPSAPPATGLKVWLKADAIGGIPDGGAVSTWPDASGGGHDALQSDPSRRPTYLAAGINGRPSLRFNGNFQYFTTNYFGPGPTGVTLFLVAKGTNYQSLIHFQKDNNYLIYPWGYQSNRPFINSNDGAIYDGLNTGLVPGEVNIGSAIWQPGTTNGARTYHNGRLVSQRDSNGNAVPQAPLRIGTHQGIGEFPTADVSEILVYSSALSDADRQSVESYLAFKYGVRTQQPANLNWTTIVTGQAGLATQTDSNLDPDTAYWYRSVAVGPGGSTPGDAVGVSTLPEAPDNPAVPTFENVGATRLDVITPALPQRATSLTLQKKSDGEPYTAYTTVATNLGAGTSTTVSGLTAQSTYQFRFVAVNAGGVNTGPSADVTTSTVDPPEVPDAPSITAVAASTVDVQMPALPARATSLDLQRGVDPGTPSTAPPTQGLQYWLKADAVTGTSNGGSVSSWPDSSGGGHHATQFNAVNQPHWIANGLNGRPVVRLDGNDDYLDVPLQSGVRTVFVVARHATGNQDYGPLLGSPTYDLHGGSGTDLFGPYTPSFVVNGQAYVDGQSVPVLSIKRPTAFTVISLVTAEPISINSLSYQAGIGGRNWNGDYAEVLLYNSELTGAERRSVEKYLYDKYNVGASSSNLNWTTVATNLSAAASFQDSGLSANTRYFYRCVAHGAGGATLGRIVGTTTAPAAPLAPHITNIGATHLTAVAPVLPEGAVSLTLQQKQDGQNNSAYVNVATGVSAGQTTLIDGLLPLHTYRFRYLAVGANGSTPGAVAVKTMQEFEPPAAPAAPSFKAIGSTTINLQTPALPTGATSLTLQRAVGTGPDVSQPPHAPANGLRLWLRADSIHGLINGALVSTWPSEGATGTDATQTIPQYQPQWIANALNGRPAVRLDGDNGYLDIPNQTGIRTVIAVVRHATGSQDYAPLLGSPSYELHGGIGSTLFGPYTSAPVTNGQAYLNGVSVPVLSLSKPTSFSLISLVTTQGVSVNSLSRQAGFGGRNWNGDYAEVLLYDTALSTADRESAESYLRAKYGMEEAPGDLNWTTVATGLSGHAPYSDESLTPNTHYFYRCIAVSPHGDTPGAVASTITRSSYIGAPEPPTAPIVLDATAPNVDLKLPTLSEGSTSHSVQRAIQVPVTAPPTTSLGVWFKADSISGLADGDGVANWPDSGADGHNAIQPGVAKRPTYVAAGLGGKPAVRFNGNGQYLLTYFDGPGGSEVTIFVVAKGTQYQSLVRYQGFRTSYLLYPSGVGGSTKFINREDGEYDGGLASGLVPGEANIGAAVWKANTPNGMRTYRNGALVAQRATNNSTLPSAPLHIGTFDDGAGDFSNADISEILVYHSALSDEAREQVEQYLAHKYAVQTAAPSNLTWTTIATEKAGHATLTDTPVMVGTTYWYRCVGVGPGGSTPGAAVSVVPHGAVPTAPSAPGAPTFEDITSSSLKVVAPALPDGATSLTLQQKLATADDTAFVDVATGVEAASRTLVTGLAAETTYAFRFVAVGQGGSTPGASAQATTLSVSGATVTANDDSYTVVQDQALSVAATGILDNDSGPQGQGLIAITGTQPSHGTLVLNQDGSFLYTPATGYHGSDSFTYQAKSGDTVSVAATVSITVTPAGAEPTNTAPQATAATVTTDEDTPLAGSVTATDADGDDLTFAVTIEPEHGSLTLAADGSYTYTPAVNYNGNDAFAFKANDGVLDSQPATVLITVAPVNDAPSAEDGAFTTAESVAVNIPLVAQDVDGDPLTYEVVTQPLHGTLSGTAPSLVYTPEDGYDGSDSFTFKVNDGVVDSAVASVSIGMTGINTPPVGEPATITAVVGLVKSGQLIAHDADGDPLTFSLLSGGTYSDVTVTSDGTFTLTPRQGSYGLQDDFTFQVSDGTDTSEAKITVNILSLHLDNDHQIDLMIRSAEQEGENWENFAGAGIFSVDATGQTWTHAGAAGTPTAFQLKVQNVTSTPQTARVKAPGQIANWTLRYFDALENGNEITSAITGNGWETNELAPGDSREFRVEFTSSGAAAIGESQEVLISATAVLSGQIDAVKARLEVGHSLDLLIADPQSGSDLYYGDDSVGPWQEVQQSAQLGLPTIFPLKIQNDGGSPKTARFSGAGSNNGWQTRYFDQREGGNDITEQVVANGWITPEIPAHGEKIIRLEVTPGTGVGVNNSFEAPLNLESTTEAADKDTVKAIATRVPIMDALVKADDPGNSFGFIGSNIYNATGEGQKASQSVAPGRPTRFIVRIDNKTNAAHSWIVTAGVVPSGWQVRFWENDHDGVEISSEVLGAGWTTPPLPAQGSQFIAVEAMPNVGLNSGDLFNLPVHVKTGDGLEEDAVQVSATTKAQRVDAMVSVSADLQSPIIGTEIYNADGTNQTLPLLLRAAPMQAYMLLKNKGGSADPLKVRRLGTDPSGWQVRYFYADEEVTAQITGQDGWTSPLVVPQEIIPLRIEVSVDSTVPAGGNLNIPLEAHIADGNSDVVKFAVSRSQFVDALIAGYGAQEDGTTFSGFGVYNSTGVGQTVKQSLSNRADGKLIFKIRARNDSSENMALVLHGGGDDANVHVQYFDAATEGNEITNAITGAQGWTTPLLNSDFFIDIRLEVTLTAAVSLESAPEISVQVETPDASAVDVVKAVVGLQNIDRLQYSKDQGATWQNVTQSNDFVIEEREGSTLGLKAIKSNPNLPWPNYPHLKPDWNQDGTINYGEQVWVTYTDVASSTGENRSIVASCGNELTAKIHVIPVYGITLKSEKDELLIQGNAGEDQTEIEAVLKKFDGSPATGLTVKLSLSGAPGAELGQAGVQDDSAISDAQGRVTLVLHAGTSVGKARVAAVVVDSAGQVMPYKAERSVEILSPHVEEPETPQPPPAPTAATLSLGEDVSAHEVPLEWTQNDDLGFERFELHRSTSAQFTPVAATLVGTFDIQDDAQTTDSGLTPATQYFYKLLTVNSEGVTATSNEVEVTTLALPTFEHLPAGVVLALDDCRALTSTAVPLHWHADALDGFDRYEIHRATTANFTPTEDTLLGIDSTSGERRSVDSEIEAGTTYYYKIVLFNQAEQSAQSNELTVHVPGVSQP